LAGKSVDPEEVRDRVAVLAKSALFEGISTGDLRVLATMFKRRDLADGEILCRSGDRADSVFAVASGQIDVYLPDTNAPVACKKPGDIVGEYGMFLASRRSATLKALGSTSVLMLDYEHFKRFLLAFPQSMMLLLGQLVNRSQAAQARRP